MTDINVGIIGLGFVGSAMYKSFKLNKVSVIGYDKYKNGGIGKLTDCLDTDIIFLALPTLYDSTIKQYNKKAIHNVCESLALHKYSGIVVIKSTVEPETVKELSTQYKLNFVHNPEFLTARTAFEDFHSQTHIVLGKTDLCNEDLYQTLKLFYTTYYPDAKISECTSTESESMKIFVNSYYSVKIQFFNELYLLCDKNNTDYNKIKSMMLANNWINPMHTNVPGPDGQLSYGGACFPKDTNALKEYMDSLDNPSKVLSATIEERNEMRDD